MNCSPTDLTRWCRCARRFAFLALLGSCPRGEAADGAESLPPFSFGGPEVLKTDWSTRALSIADLDGDALNDMAVINNDAARIELFYQVDPSAPDGAERKRLPRNRWEPVLEDARFVNESITVGFPMFDLAVGDLNADGAPDLAYTSREVPLTVRYQESGGNWNETEEFEQFEALGWVSTVEIADLDGDRDNELVVLAGDALRVFHPVAEGDLGEPDVYRLTGENPFNLMLADVNDDGLKDALYISTDGKQSLVVREQLKGAAFGPELRFVLERPVRNIRVVYLPDGSGSPVFCAVNSRSGGLELFALSIREAGDLSNGFEDARPEIYPISTAGRASAVYALADVDGDGRDDVLVAEPSAAELTLYPAVDGGFGAPAAFPTFSGVSSLSVGRFGAEGGTAIALVSASEKMLGISFLNTKDRVSFPDQVVLENGQPLTCAAMDADGDGLDELAVVVEEGGAMRLLLLQPEDRTEVPGGGEWKVVSDTELEGVRRKPSSIRVIDVFEGGRSGLMVFVPREAPVFLSADAEAPFALKARGTDSSIRESMLKDVEAAQVSCFDVDGDGLSELVVGRTGYARALKWNGNALEMVDQFNARRSEDPVTAVIPLIGEGGMERILLYVESIGELQFLEPGEDGVYRFAQANQVGGIDLVDWSLTGTKDRDGAALFMAGGDRFWRLPTVGNRWERSEVGNYETDLEDVHFNFVTGVEMDDDGSLELIAVDGAEHVVEILSFDGSEGSWQSRMYWEIFEQNMHYQGRTGANIEPRQVLTDDLNGDDRPDFVFLVHDRILIYPQE